MHLVYQGFEQKKNIRQYVFHQVETGQETKVLVVSTDLALFNKNHLGLQDGPALCLGVLTAELEAGEWPQQPLSRDLTDRHMQAYILARGTAAAKKKAGPKKGLRPPPS